jgi:predicted metal-dependent phosphotriesterase family hydrolase
MKWTTEIAKVIDINDLRRTHIVNAVNWLIDDERYGNLWKDGHQDFVWVDTFIAELKRRGHDQKEIDDLVSKSNQKIRLLNIDENQK